jgi:enoyl-CoA hydratase/carnithine racemase
MITTAFPHHNATLPGGIAMSEHVHVVRNGRILEVTIDKPPANAIEISVSQALGEAMVTLRDDPELSVGIITGSGEKIFCAGWDLKALNAGEMSTDNWWEDDYGPGGFAGVTELWDLDKPVIAALNGLTIGGGFEIALACDLIIAAENAIFALPEPRVGLAALAGGVHRLPREIGMKQAMGMLLTGRRVGAAEGKELGFVTAVAPAGQALAVAKEWAAQILECAPLSVRGSKEAAMQGMGAASLEDAIRGKYDQIQAMYKSADFVEGPRAFAEKRTPDWKGE